MLHRITSPWKEEDRSTIREIIKNDGLVSFPTETFYALGGNAFSEIVVRKVFAAKHRSPDQALLLLITPEWLPQLTAYIPEKTQKLLDIFWPGPLTVVFPAHPELPAYLEGPQKSIALRHSNSEIVNQLIQVAKTPLIGTSANLSQQVSLDSADAVAQTFMNSLDLLIDCGSTKAEQPSTLISTMTSPYSILREGRIPQTKLEEFL